MGANRVGDSCVRVTGRVFGEYAQDALVHDVRAATHTAQRAQPAGMPFFNRSRAMNQRCTSLGPS
jgi:hypothetical protein